MGLAATKLASMQKLNITTDTLISVYDVTHLKIKESSSGFEQEILAYALALWSILVDIVQLFKFDCSYFQSTR